MPKHEQRSAPGTTAGTRRRTVALAAVAAAGLLAAACGSSSSTPTTGAAASSTTGTNGSAAATNGVVAAAARGSVGVVLTDGEHGPTLYRYTPDGTGTPSCTGSCATVWPPLTVPAGTTSVGAGSGVSAVDLGTAVRPDGTLQVTYRHMPLYRYSGDTQPTQTNGQGVGGIWFVVHPTGGPSGTVTSTTTAPSSPRVSGY